MNGKLTLDMESLTVTTFETDSNTPEANANATLACDPGCNTTRLTCSTKLC
ncbi:MAG TPA: hypothetical protein VFJ16_10105 [Longimicrobium sp.]|nr:hypothetical protein [Longimicrobium sp.]